MMGFYNSMGVGSFGGFGLYGPFFVVVLLWSLYWKGRSLWIAAKKDSKYWFVALLVINTMGILEILYIYLFSKKGGCCEGKDGGSCCKEGKSCIDGKCCKNGECNAETKTPEKIDDSCGCGHEHK